MIISYVPETEVYSRAFQLLRECKNTLHLTMIMDKELDTPSTKYMQLLKKKIAMNIEVKRVGFGTKKQYGRAMRQLGYTTLPNNFRFKYTTDRKTVQRMFLVDSTKLLFAVYLQDQRFVFYTRHKVLVQGFLTFFNMLFAQSDY
ncbi:hypothetical protein COU88_01575 [Candidatus Roizmanbacteria bacterium CG10_big_fil_rev_8_21_14_0_10_39_6]|uniref:Uncharacterized protein n=1 Tax=Candidatus Roizmanbacteria bacterium CG10_big_fil_rev_8_21_14_0_10_39_6 TaxID=1974853 RepID=A0A2M8KT11_9BACT|nr:MAG: hypothetical protein COU88_01575 [Candidatus Roizmanbacteria bacterium CG10_big_fil_rev_8_21_14_0_10_39_6]